MPSLAATLSPCNLKRVHLCGSAEAREDIVRPSHPEAPSHCAPLFRALVQNQWAYAQYLKLTALFVIAISHVLYMSSFLNVFSALMDYADGLDAKVTAFQSYPLRHQIELLAGMRVVDLVAFSTLPALLLARSMLIESIGEHLPDVLGQMEQIPSTSELTDALGCSLTDTENGEFSKKTDVWSFGVLIWEIFTRCSSDPFPQQTNAEAKAKILSGKQPMELPKGTPPKIVQAMSICFTQNPEERPDFEPLFRILAPNEQPPAPMDMWDTYVA